MKVEVLLEAFKYKFGSLAGADANMGTPKIAEFPKILDTFGQRDRLRQSRLSQAGSELPVYMGYTG